MIISTFASAQKVAATHVDAVLGDNDGRVGWARRSLARRGHGLNATEPIESLIDYDDDVCPDSRDSSLSSCFRRPMYDSGMGSSFELGSATTQSRDSNEEFKHNQISSSTSAGSIQRVESNTVVAA